jgi:hypothetical protein
MQCSSQGWLGGCGLELEGLKESLRPCHGSICKSCNPVARVFGFDVDFKAQGADWVSAASSPSPPLPSRQGSQRFHLVHHQTSASGPSGSGRGPKRFFHNCHPVQPTRARQHACGGHALADDDAASPAMHDLQALPWPGRQTPLVRFVLVQVQVQVCLCLAGSC